MAYLAGSRLVVLLVRAAVKAEWLISPGGQPHESSRHNGRHRAGTGCPLLASQTAAPTSSQFFGRYVPGHHGTSLSAAANGHGVPRGDEAGGYCGIAAAGSRAYAHRALVRDRDGRVEYPEPGREQGG